MPGRVGETVAMPVLIAIVVWLLFGLAVAAVMIRRGHSTAIWLSLAFLGPLTIFLVLSAVDEEHPSAAQVVEGTRGTGTIDVVVGLDGSPASEAALDAVPALFGDRLRHVTVATVLDFDVDQLPGRPAPRVEAEQRLTAAADRFAAASAITPDQALLSGKPAEALVRHAADKGSAVVVVGVRGAGAHLALGSTAKALADHSSVPVLLVPSAG